MISTAILAFDQIPMGQAPSPRGLPVEQQKSEAEDATLVLIARAREGDVNALNDLCTRYLPRLTRWAHGRLPAGARGAIDTHDVVQETLAQSFGACPRSSPGTKGRSRDTSAARCSTGFATKRASSGVRGLPSR